jgi:CRP/FNR family transcriptional regulator
VTDSRPPQHLLSSISYLAELDEAAQSAIARNAVRREYAAGEMVFVQGDACTGLHLVAGGWLKVFKLAPSGREQVMRFVGPGEAVGEFAVFASTPQPASVSTLEPATLWLIRRESLLGLLQERPAISQAVITALARRVEHLLALVEDLSLRTVEARLARYLLQAADEDVVRRHRWTTQAELAARLGTVLEVLNRALRSLVEAGLIALDRQRIVILDREGLQRRADADG